MIEITAENVEAAFTYQPWDQEQIRRGTEIRAALVQASQAILRNAPRCPLRTRALNAIFDARMLANAAISLEDVE